MPRHQEGLLEPLLRAREQFELNDFDKSDIGYAISSGTHWSADLLRLIAKSDPERRAAIRLVFPSHVDAYEKWWNES